MMDIIITGTSESGKTSIKKVTFEKNYPYETVFNGKTVEPEKLNVKSMGFCELNIIEFPSTFSFDKSTEVYNKYLSNCQVLIFLIDTQEQFHPQIEYFEKSILPIFEKYNKIPLYIFLHKVDNTNIGQNDYMKQRGEIQSKFKNLLSNHQKKLNSEEINLTFYLTSIYNSTLFEAFSRIFQDLLPQNKNLSSLIEILSHNCGFLKAYLFDVFNKVYLAIDDNPIDSDIYKMCSDLIDVVLDMTGIYGDKNGNEDSYFDDNSGCSIKVNDNNNNKKRILFLKFIHKNLALIAVIEEENYERNNLLDYNINIFRQGVKAILKV